ncbi:group 1 truncated hemoglobin [Haliea sp. E1-2-M8]|uniref:group I truncated hemoglobin n=1 Tax=Haliea sp. E1-2-M8 TaxID=3064706 RepID=UPI00271AA887|nr:group 1 truncated hemoglobin [Haliea sp. E1-2-M8]MDO8863304.1 group 1 truncated hemoglobin [Haliea sp. E1-2-M8]
MWVVRTLLLLATLALVACGTVAPGERTLFERLGGMPGVDRIVAGLLWEIAEDPLVLPLFADTDIERFRNKLVEQLCEVADGPCRYSGDSMTETHRRLGITSAQFNSLVDDLIRAMEREGVPVGAQNALLQRLARMHADIVAG